MRRPTDLPRRRAFGRVSGRIVLIVVAVLLFALIVFGRALARFYVDYLWHDSLGRSDVFWGVLWTKIALFLAFLVVFLVLAGLNLYIADRTAPRAFPANVHPYVERFHEVFGHRLRLVRYGTAAVLALILALPAAGSLAGLDAVPQQHVVRCGGRAVRRRRRLLRVRVAVHLVGRVACSSSKDSPRIHPTVDEPPAGAIDLRRTFRADEQPLRSFQLASVGSPRDEYDPSRDAGAECRIGEVICADRHGECVVRWDLVFDEAQNGSHLAAENR